MKSQLQAIYLTNSVIYRMNDHINFSDNITCLVTKPFHIMSNRSIMLNTSKTSQNIMPNYVKQCLTIYDQMSSKLPKADWLRGIRLLYDLEGKLFNSVA